MQVKKIMRLKKKKTLKKGKVEQVAQILWLSKKIFFQSEGF